MIGSSPRLAIPLCTAIICLACSPPLELGSDLLWTASHESGDLSEWTAESSGEIKISNASDDITVSSEGAHRGHFSVKLVNATLSDRHDEGPELSRILGAESDAYYSAWFQLADSYQLTSDITLLRLRSRSSADNTLFDGEDVQVRSTPDGQFVVTALSHNPAFLRAPVADPAPLVGAKQWFQLELRYEPQSSGRLRVWLDGKLVYDLSERAGSPGDQMVLSACNCTEEEPSEPLVVFLDDAAVSLSRVAPDGRLAN
jgi:hypothetical protein